VFLVGSDTSVGIIIAAIVANVNIVWTRAKGFEQGRQIVEWHG
jgi:hypothetical protein